MLVLEREKFPRYHIGESLLPFTCYPLKRLGLLEKMRQSAFVKKYSVQFVSPSGKASQPFYFSTRYEPEVAQTWQVLRSEFDQMLLDNARAKGALVLEETTVTELLRERERTVGMRRRKRRARLEFRAPITWIAPAARPLRPPGSTGGSRAQTEQSGGLDLLPGALRDPGIDAGATTLLSCRRKGWFWYIPQHRDIVSVGVVAEGKYLTRGGVRDPEANLLSARSTKISGSRTTLPPARRGPHCLTSEFSFRSRYGAAEAW